MKKILIISCVCLLQACAMLNNFFFFFFEELKSLDQVIENNAQLRNGKFQTKNDIRRKYGLKSRITELKTSLWENDCKAEKNLQISNENELRAKARLYNACLGNDNIKGLSYKNSVAMPVNKATCACFSQKVAEIGKKYECGHSYLQKLAIKSYPNMYEMNTARYRGYADKQPINPIVDIVEYVADQCFIDTAKFSKDVKKAKRKAEQEAREREQQRRERYARVKRFCLSSYSGRNVDCECVANIPAAAVMVDLIDMAKSTRNPYARYDLLGSASQYEYMILMQCQR